MTLRQLLRMAEHRARFDWGQTAELLALIYNVNRGSNQRPVHANDINPYAERQKQNVVKVKGVGILKTLFVDRKGTT